MTKVPKKDVITGNDLPLARLDVGRIQIADLEVGEELLRWGAVVAVRTGIHRRDLESGEHLLRLFVNVVACAIEHDHRVAAPVWILCIEALNQLKEERAEDSRVSGGL